MTPEPILPFIRKKGSQLHHLNLPMLLAIAKKGNSAEEGKIKRLEGLRNLPMTQHKETQNVMQVS